MSNYKAYCLDLDGTVYRGETPIIEAVEFIHYLQGKGIEPLAFTGADCAMFPAGIFLTDLLWNTIQILFLGNNLRKIQGQH